MPLGGPNGSMEGLHQPLSHIWYAVKPPGISETKVSLADTAVSCCVRSSSRICLSRRLVSYILSNALGHWFCRTLIGIAHADQGSYHVYDYNSFKPTVARQQPYRLLSRGGVPGTTSVSNCRSYPFCTTLQGMLDSVEENDTNFQSYYIKFIFSELPMDRS